MQIPERLYPEGTPKFGWRIDEIMAWAGDHLARSDAFRNQTEIVKQLKKEHSELFNSAPYEGTIAAMRAWAKREAEKLQSLHLFEAQIKRENAWHTKAINRFNAGLLRPKSQSTPIPGPQIFNSAAPRYAQWTQEDFSLVRRLLPDWIGKNPVKVVIYDALGISGYDHESHRVLMYTEKSHGARGSRVRTRGRGEKPSFTRCFTFTRATKCSKLDVPLVKHSSTSVPRMTPSFPSTRQALRISRTNPTQ